MSNRNTIRNNKHHYSLTTLFASSLTILTLLSLSVLSSPKASADSSAGVNVSVTVPATCSLTANPDTLSTTITPGNTGTIGTSTIKAICNDPAGLAVYAVGYTNDIYGNNNLASTVGGTTINIPTAIASSPSTSQWNMTINAVSGTYAPTIPQDFENTAHIIPTQYTKVAYRNTMTDMGTNATGAQFNATFTAYIGPTQAAGTYTGKVKFLIVHPNVLTYNDQTGEPATVQPATLARDPEALPIGGCSADSPILQNVAIWGDSVILEQTIDAIDLRDNQCYKVKRLKMNAIGTETALWMSNLNLGAEAFVVSELNNTNTHLAPGVSAIPIIIFTTWNRAIYGSSNSYTDPIFTPLTVLNSSNGQIEDSYGNKYGTLYNYAAASAGTYVYDRQSGIGDATSDLCPAGWRLPTGGSSSGEFRALATSYSIDSQGRNVTVVQEDLGFPFAGSDANIYGVPYDQGSSGRYWSSTYRGYNFMYRLSFSSSFFSATSYYDRNDGQSVRCIAQ